MVDDTGYQVDPFVAKIRIFDSGYPTGISEER